VPGFYLAPVPLDSPASPGILLKSGCYYATAPVPRLTNGLRLTETVQNTVFCEDETAG